MPKTFDLYATYQFIKKLTTPFDEMDAYHLGIIDDKGNVLKKQNELKTQTEKDSFTLFDMVVVNLKKFLAKLPGGSTKFATYSAALYLMKEGNNVHPYTCQAGLLEFMANHNENDTIFKYLEEEAPTNIVSGGSVAGMDGKSRPMFAATRVFDVDTCYFDKCREGKRKYAKYEDYVGSDSTGNEIREYGRTNPGKPIIVRDTKTGVMQFLRYGKAKMFGEEVDQSLDEFLVLKPLPQDTLGVHRNEMPQFKSADYPEMFEFLKTKGIRLKAGHEKAGDLKPIQKNFYDDKVEKALSMGNSKPKPIIVSSDNYIIDGHHRWLGIMNTNRNTDMPVLKANVKIRELLAAIKEFPKVYFSHNGSAPKPIKESIKSIKTALFESGEVCSTFTGDQLKELERFADRLLNKVGLDIEFTKHFGERMSDSRNKPCIKISELQDIFQKIANSKGMKIRNHGEGEAVLKDIQKDLNLPVVIRWGRDGMLKIVHKTIMRKKNFHTPDDVIKV